LQNWPSVYRFVSSDVVVVAVAVAVAVVVVSVVPIFSHSISIDFRSVNAKM
jgi:hypothetical protein